MSTLLPGSKVLVTGINGFLASWVAKTLLEAGYSVRGTVRSEKKGVYFRKIFAHYGEKFEIVVVEDITAHGAFDEALKGVHAVHHVASPASFSFKVPSDCIEPAVRGTTGILESATVPGSTVKAIVITSSISAIFGDLQQGLVDETLWNETGPREIENWQPGVEISPITIYTASKALAEKAAWSFYEKNRSKIGWTLSTILPSFLFGPVIHECNDPSQLNVTAKWFYDIVSNTLPSESTTFPDFSWVDVRDAALAHKNAMENPAANGERFITSTEFVNWEYWSYEVELKKDPQAKPPVPDPKQTVFNNKKAREVLSIQFTHGSKTLKDAEDDFRAKGWLA